MVSVNPPVSAGRPVPDPPCPPARGPRQRVPTAGTDAKRERILRAAERLFHEQGYERTTLDQVAAALGVSKPYVYYYFRNKQELFERLSWTPAVACFTVLDDPDLAALPAHRQVAEALRRLIARTLAHYPAAFFFYREPQAYRPEYMAAQKALANHFYDQLCALLERARDEGRLQFQETRITALAACSLPGFLYSWYRPDGRLGVDEVTEVLGRLAWRVVGLGEDVANG